MSEELEEWLGGHVGKLIVFVAVLPFGLALWGFGWRMFWVMLTAPECGCAE